MRKLVFFIALLFPATAAYANPVGSPFGIFKPFIYYGACFGAEVSVVVIILFFCHIWAVPLTFVLFAGNLIFYIVLFRPMLSATGSVPASEAVIVLVEAAFIKFLSSLDSFRMDDFKRLRWVTAIIIAAVGNWVSYYSGLVLVVK
jgi:hypothetical protein